jgi:hypothetical protein
MVRGGELAEESTQGLVVGFCLVYPENEDELRGTGEQRRGPWR